MHLCNLSSLLCLQALQIFANILVGSLDATVFRYLLLISDLIDRVDWKYVEDFKAFATAIYPFLNVRQFLFK